MKLFLIVFVISVLLSTHVNLSYAKDQTSTAGSSKLTTAEYRHLVQQVADGWGENNARKAADCFTQNAVYIEPPDRQLYKGRQALFEFFGGSKGRENPMQMTWHHLIFDETKQIGTGEYTFAYKGRKTHGIVIIQIENKKIHRWREYQYRSTVDWDVFVGDSIF